MNSVLVVLLLIASSTELPHQSRIFGGQNATAGQFPYMVALNDFDQYCNGVILTQSWILTTAACLFGISPFAEVYVGSNINQENGAAYRLFEKVVHQDFDNNTMQNNIGLVRINAALEFSDTIQPIELGTDPAPNSTCTTMGWGVNDALNYPPLQYIDLPIIDLATCQNVSGDSLGGFYLGQEHICTLGELGQGACWGDAGGALVCNGTLSGILSYGVQYDDQCGIGLPEVYLRMATYTEWILSYIQS